MSLVNSDADKNIKFIALDSLRKKKEPQVCLRVLTAFSEEQSQTVQNCL